MKFRSFFILATLALLLTACNFTLAADVTPPPGYVPPTPMPTMGPLYPASVPDVDNGAKIYVEKCLPCHGVTGLGDGEKGKQLPITVAAIGLADFAQNALPSAWYKQVTQGNIERFMPPFASLNDRERWDVVAYALTLHTTPDQIEKGKSLFESKCAGCVKYFSDPATMSALSENDLIAIIKNGQGDIPAFGKDITDEEAAAVAIYLRSLTFAAPLADLAATPIPSATPTSAAVTPSAEVTPADVTPASETTTTPESGTPAADVTPAEGTPATTTTAGAGSAKGLIENKTGKAFPANTVVTLFGYEHGGDPAEGPAEVFKQEGVVNADGTYKFENIDIPADRIFLSEIVVDGAIYRSQYVIVTAGTIEVALNPITLYATTEDFSSLKINLIQFSFDLGTQGQTKVFTVYSITNDTDKAIVVNGADQDIPFVAFPNGADKLGYEPTQDSAPFSAAGENGFSMPPNKNPYGLIALSSFQETKDISISQPVLLPVEKVVILLPEGMDAEGKNLTDEGLQPMQDGKNAHVYTSDKMKKGATIEFKITGEPKSGADVNPDTTQDTNWVLIGVGAFGFVLVLLGAWLFVRDRRKSEEEPDEENNDEDENEDEFDDPESIMDAIIALDDLHRAGKISDAAYQKRREELKNALKRKS